MRVGRPDSAGEASAVPAGSTKGIGPPAAPALTPQAARRPEARGAGQTPRHRPREVAREEGLPNEILTFSASPQNPAHPETLFHSTPPGPSLARHPAGEACPALSPASQSDPLGGLDPSTVTRTPPRPRPGARHTTPANKTPQSAAAARCAPTRPDPRAGSGRGRGRRPGLRRDPPRHRCARGAGPDSLTR